MSSEHIAFIGDIHGNVKALVGLLSQIDEANVECLVFLGDYIDKGSDSAAVIDRLVSESKRRSVVLLKGNHEQVLLTALDTGDLTHFLKVGGASTIRSYVNRSVHADVLSDFRSNLPTAHIDLVRRMQERFEHPEVVASHVPIAGADPRFRISAHISVGLEPVINVDSARIDTGCGSAENGRLTAFIWPTLNYLQVDGAGRRVLT